jgi:hypothetical protein
MTYDDTATAPRIAPFKTSELEVGRRAKLNPLTWYAAALNRD